MNRTPEKQNHTLFLNCKTYKSLCLCVMCQQLDHLWLPDTDFLSTDLLPVANLFCKEQGFVFSSLSLQKLLHYTRHLNICNKKLISSAHKNQIWLWLKKMCTYTSSNQEINRSLIYKRTFLLALTQKEDFIYPGSLSFVCMHVYKSKNSFLYWHNMHA